LKVIHPQWARVRVVRCHLGYPIVEEGLWKVMSMGVAKEFSGTSDPEV